MVNNPLKRPLISWVEGGIAGSLRFPVLQDDEVGEDEEVMEEGSVVSTVGAGGFRVSDFLKNLLLFGCLDCPTVAT